MPINTTYRPEQGPQLELASNPVLVWQLRQLKGSLPIQYSAQVALMEIAASRIEAMHADYTSYGPMTDDERRKR